MKRVCVKQANADPLFLYLQSAIIFFHSFFFQPHTHSNVYSGRNPEALQQGELKESTCRFVALCGKARLIEHFFWGVFTYANC
jgi:hypothetical protein